MRPESTLHLFGPSSAWMGRVLTENTHCTGINPGACTGAWRGLWTPPLRLPQECWALGSVYALLSQPAHCPMTAPGVTWWIASSWPHALWVQLRPGTARSGEGRVFAPGTRSCQTAPVIWLQCWAEGSAVGCQLLPPCLPLETQGVGLSQCLRRPHRFPEPCMPTRYPGSPAPAFCWDSGWSEYLLLFHKPIPVG